MPEKVTRVVGGETRECTVRNLDTEGLSPEEEELVRVREEILVAFKENPKEFREHIMGLADTALVRGQYDITGSDDDDDDDDDDARIQLRDPYLRIAVQIVNEDNRAQLDV